MFTSFVFQRTFTWLCRYNAWEMELIPILNEKQLFCFQIQTWKHGKIFTINLKTIKSSSSDMTCNRVRWRFVLICKNCWLCEGSNSTNLRKGSNNLIQFFLMLKNTRFFFTINLQVLLFFIFIFHLITPIWIFEHIFNYVFKLSFHACTCIWQSRKQNISMDIRSNHNLHGHSN